MYFEILICVNLVKEDKRTWFWGDMRTREHGFGEDKRTREHGFGEDKRTREHGFGEDKRTWFFERQENMRT